MQKGLEAKLTAARAQFYARSDSSRRRRVCLGFFLIATCMFLAVFGPMFLVRRSFIWRVDGLRQHFPFMAYIGQWIREAVSALFSGEAIPLFDFSLGFGSDVIQSMNYYGLGDPLVLLSAFFSEENTEICYSLLIYLRYLLAGYAFLAFARELKLRTKYAIPAAIVYAFSTYMLSEAAIRHPFFANPLIHLPLILMGAERALRGKSPAALVLSMAWSAMCGFYFLYVNSAFLLIYALIRHFQLCREKPWRKLFPTALRLIGYYCVGLLIAGVLLLPPIIGFLQCARQSAGDVGNLLFHSLSTYLKFPVITVVSQGYTEYPVMPVLCVLAAALTLRRGEKNRSLRAAFVLSAVFAFSPFIAYALNGFSYISTRWRYATVLVLSMALAAGMGRLVHPSASDKRRIRLWGCALIAYSIALYVLERLLGTEWIAGWLIAIGVALVLASLAVLRFVHSGKLRRLADTRPNTARLLGYALCMALILGNTLGLNWLSLRLSLGMGTQARIGTAWNDILNSPLHIAPDPQEGEFFRVGMPQDDALTYNEGASEHKPTTIVYNSIIEGPLVGGLLETGNMGVINANCIAGLDGRAVHMAVWSQKYFACSDAADAQALYGFTQVGEADGYLLYENENALPLGYATDRYILQEDYLQLTPAERTWALLQGAVLEEADERYRKIAPENTAVVCPVQIVEMENATWEDGVLTIAQAPATIRMRFEGVPYSENYLQMRGFAQIGGKVLQQVYAEYATDDLAGSTTMGSMYVNAILAREETLNNLGYCERAQTELALTFTTEAVYSLEELGVVCQPMEGMEAYVEALREETLTDVCICANRISGRVDLSTDKVLILSIPYTAGWSAFVDGEEAEILPSGTSFCALKLQAGSHEIVLKYCTPGLKLGAAMTLAGLVIFLILHVRYKRRGCRA